MLDLLGALGQENGEAGALLPDAELELVVLHLHLYRFDGRSSERNDTSEVRYFVPACGMGGGRFQRSSYHRHALCYSVKTRFV